MDNLNQYIGTLYKNFNERAVGLLISEMSTNVKWANGMEGGYVYGHEEVKEYWLRQFNMVRSNVQPIKIKEENGTITVQVHQVVHDLNGNLLGDQVVTHVFNIKEGKIAEFNILQE